MNTIDIIDCSWETLNKWFEYLDPNFKWEEYGHSGYHIDHVIPMNLNSVFIGLIYNH